MIGARVASVVLAAMLGLCVNPMPAMAAPATPTDIQIDTQGVAFQLGDEQVSIRLDGAGVVHVQAVPDGRPDKATLVIDPQHTQDNVTDARVHDAGATLTLASDRLVAVWHKQTGMLDLRNAQHHSLLRLDLTALASGHVQLAHAEGQSLYGIGSYTTNESVDAGIERSGQHVAKAGEQGHAGAPFVWSTAGYGVLVDSNGAVFDLKPEQITVSGLAELAVDVYLMVGEPPQLFAELARLSGHAPMFPKWSMGFINTQWGIDQKELLGIVDTYRRKHIPIDGFILDFDWKAWGKDHYGEFRWNREKFPAGPGGKLADMLAARGIHLGGIMKPRIHVDTVEGRYATVHDMWLPADSVSLDYFSHQPVKELDFNKPAVRQWYGNKAMKYAFDQGIVAWWNDEAGTTGSNTSFLNMQRSLYDAQRAHSDIRVWSLNRNFWLGSQRYAYGLWSGDIKTGFETMAKQRARMLSAVNVGVSWWGMDGGGFHGHPSDENYARWIEFGAFTPVFRVHGTLGEKRQPWRYGPVAEKAATRAIRLRYELIPYIYSYAWNDHVAGVGLVRPLIFGWPDDPNVRNDVQAWMFGQWLLVSPVVKQGQTRKSIYLPDGTWTNWFTGERHRGGQTIIVTTDSKTWKDIPLFIRQGAIIPTQPVMDYVGERPVATISVDVFPAERKTHFDYYEDDGDTYAYEHGEYYLQRLSVQKNTQGVQFDVGAPKGHYQPALSDYLVKVHGLAAASVQGAGHRYATLEALKNADGVGWATGSDRYGPVTWMRLDARHAQAVHLTKAGSE
ncbi:MAG TPA: TIM-barrel domain-containing protein [Oleiagrimonas sp.]|nr:TIM-barrel domain-containing protein [Oleiagrimonas sp.]